MIEVILTITIFFILLMGGMLTIATVGAIKKINQQRKTKKAESQK